MSKVTNIGVSEIKNLCSAFNRRDIHAALSLMTDDVRWPKGWEGRSVRGHDGVRSYWTRQWEEVDIVVEPLEIKVRSDGRIVVRMMHTMRQPDGTLQSAGHTKQVYTFRDGLIARMDIEESELPNEKQGQESTVEEIRHRA